MTLHLRANSAAAESLRGFLGRLRDTYRAREPGDANAKVIQSMELVVACLEYWRRRPEDSAPLQVAVIGPTQVGKSTVVNLLLGAEQAEASPLAAFTDRLYGFVQEFSQQDHQWIADVRVSRHAGLALDHHQVG